MIALYAVKIYHDVIDVAVAEGAAKTSRFCGLHRRVHVTMGLAYLCVLGDKSYCSVCLRHVNVVSTGS